MTDPANDSTIYWAEPVERLLAAVDSRIGGLSSREADERRARFGPNALRASSRAGPLLLLFSQFRSPLVLVLVGAAIVSAVVQQWADAAIVLMVVVGSGMLGFVQEYTATTAVEKLRARVSIQARVLRDGEPRSIPAEDVVPGDIVLLSAGSLIPADGVVLEVKDCSVNQAVLTGETFPAEKRPGPVEARTGMSERTNCVFMGTSVRSGTARALIVRTGSATAFGQVAERLRLRPPETEFERGIRQFGYLLTQVMTVLVLTVFAVNVFTAKPPVDSLLFAIALAVGLTPELLPAIISVTLASGAQEMARRGVIVRRLNAIENFGSMDILCTDKTGTLTEGAVRLEAAREAGGDESEAVLRLAYLNARFQTGLTNPLDEAILAEAERAGLVPGAEEKVDEVPYDFVRKRLSVVVRDGAGLRLIAKGALENILEVCSHTQDQEGVRPLTDTDRAEIGERYREWSGQGLRTLGLAVKTLGPTEAERSLVRSDEQGMAFAGFLLFADPARPDAHRAVADLARLGVAVKIVTGDNRLVTTRVAEIVGMPVAAVVSGTELDELSDEALWHTVTRTTLFVEVDPNQKERIIRALQKSGHVVGYLGDGINDAPALHAADVGVSVDSAVDVAKEAADIVLLERSLDVLRRGIEAGRVTFANTLKYLFTTTSANFGNMLSMAGASLFLPFLPLLAKQILLNNFLSDLPGMALAGDNVDREWVEAPRRWDIRFIRDFMILFGVVSSVFDFATFGVLLLVVRAAPAEFRTAWFVESLLTELVVALVVRTRKPFFRSRPGRLLWVSTLLVAGIALALPYLGIGRPLGFTPLPPEVVGLLILIAGLYVAAAEGTKRFFYGRLHPE